MEAKTSPRNKRELIAVLLTAFGKFLFMDYLEWRFFFVSTATLLWLSYIFYQKRSNHEVLREWGFRTDNFGTTLRLVLPFGIVALLGAVVGIGLGVGYARAIIAGLQSWWIGAISTNFLHFFASPVSLAIGAVAGLLCSGIAILWGLRAAQKLTPLANLRGKNDSGSGAVAGRRVYAAVSLLAVVGAICLSFLGLG